MKKKPERDIPNFSRHPTQMAAGTGPHGSQPQQQSNKPVRQAPTPPVKPHATSAKSGRRGQ
jgi:hypothetical protein